MADYAYKEDESPAAAREARLGWLRDLAAVPEAEDTPLAAFTARHHGISSIIGYDKAAMVFFMLRDEIGKEAFERGLRLFWQRHRFQRAGWADLEHTFAQAAGRDLGAFFRQWVQRAGAPRLKLGPAKWADGKLGLKLEQADPPYALLVPPASEPGPP
ncbi:MAG: M1 family aminopeptidase [Gallionellaceae bacterium]|nr:M1 family aminopeptidase [Gallionellaceae bacterium]